VWPNDEQRAIQAMATDFAREHVIPWLSELENGNIDTLRELWRLMGECGLTGLPFEDAYGGAGVDALSYVMVLEELAKVSASLATSLSVHLSVGALPIVTAGTEAQKQHYLPKLATGELIAAFGLTEPNSGSDASAGETRAERQADGSYVLNGTKLFITNALIARIFVVTAKTATKDGKPSLTAFIIDKDTPGFTVTKGEPKLGLCGSDWGELRFEHCLVPADQRLGDEGKGMSLFLKCLETGRVSIGAISLGIAQACLDASREYALQREQFHKRLADMQAIQFKLADMATGIEAARALVYNAARLKEAGKPFIKEASMAKLFASETANRCAREAVQIFGGYGYTKDFPVERYFRDAKAMELVEGTSQIQRLIIARQLLQ
jgi:alkylation response protein AidB-like acyl-CoA dehydrogenase